MTVQRRVRTLFAVLVAGVAAVAVAVPAHADGRSPARSGVGYSAGSAGIGDPYFPTLGNGGYEVDSYHVDLTWDPSAHAFTSATATIVATPSKNLSQFDLDLIGFHVDSVAIDGSGAGFSRTGHELVVTPTAPGLPVGTPFTTVVAYHGVPQHRSDPLLGDEGWFNGATDSFVAGEPIGSSFWFPSNDHPADKALFSLTATVPDGYQVVSNGLLSSTSSAAGSTTYVWADAAHPMPTYAAVVSIGHYRIHHWTTPSGLPVYNAVST
jgi:aminopeptidase N